MRTDISLTLEVLATDKGLPVLLLLEIWQDHVSRVMQFGDVPCIREPVPSIFLSKSTLKEELHMTVDNFRLAEQPQV